MNFDVNVGRLQLTGMSLTQHLADADK